jgi:hypothetical protein
MINAAIKIRDIQRNARRLLETAAGQSPYPQDRFAILLGPRVCGFAAGGSEIRTVGPSLPPLT